MSDNYTDQRRFEEGGRKKKFIYSGRDLWLFTLLL